MFLLFGCCVVIYIDLIIWWFDRCFNMCKEVVGVDMWSICKWILRRLLCLVKCKVIWFMNKWMSIFLMKMWVWRRWIIFLLFWNKRGLSLLMKFLLIVRVCWFVSKLVWMVVRRWLMNLWLLWMCLNWVMIWFVCILVKW